MTTNSLYVDGPGHDACGVISVANLKGVALRSTTDMLLRGCEVQMQRGGISCDGRSGDGAGILTNIPIGWARRLANAMGLPQYAAGEVGIGMFFMPADLTRQREDTDAIERVLHEYFGGDVRYHWRFVPVNPTSCGRLAAESCPEIRQLWIVQGSHRTHVPFEITLYYLQKRIEREISRFAEQRKNLPVHERGTYIASLSCRRIVYKGMLTGTQVGDFYIDLQDEDFEVVAGNGHVRFSTNTKSAWKNAQPFMLSHNGEFNTLLGNQAFSEALEAASGGDLDQLKPFLNLGLSDSGQFSNFMHLLSVRTGQPFELLLAMAMPSAWEKHPHLPAHIRDFWLYLSGKMPPWDGPAAIHALDFPIECASDDVQKGIIICRQDRNGLRPMRWHHAAPRNGSQELIVCASETGASLIPSRQQIAKGRLGPGQMLVADSRTGEFRVGDEVIDRLARQIDYGALTRNVFSVPSFPPAVQPPEHLLRVVAGDEPALSAYGEMAAFGWDFHDLHQLVRSMVVDGKEKVRAMGDDTPMAVLSLKPRPLADYFKQRFAQVTNPPVASDLEAIVASLTVLLGVQDSPFEVRSPLSQRVKLQSCVLTPAVFHWLTSEACPLPWRELDMTFDAARGKAGLQEALDRIARDAQSAVATGTQLLVLSDRKIDRDRAAVPSLLAVGSLNEHLIRQGMRVRTSLIVDSGEIREPHLAAGVISYGASAIFPRLMYRAGNLLAESEGDEEVQAVAGKIVPQIVKGLEAAILKVMSKMGITTVMSYIGSRLFEVYGLKTELVRRAFGPTPATLEGHGLSDIARAYQFFHRRGLEAQSLGILPDDGFFEVNPLGGEVHQTNPLVVQTLQRAIGFYEPVPPTEVRRDLWEQYTAALEATGPINLRDTWAIKPFGPPIPLDQVEPASAILRRFKTAPMSHGSINGRIHEDIAIAMNRIGGRAGSGEGGMSRLRYALRANGDNPACSEVQLASGRFGVTPEYLARASAIEIKMAQGSKPGEGGHLPGKKVSPEIAELRYCEPGTELVSPPPHHDIYSIEDLGQVIDDLRMVNRDALMSVKLVSTRGIGTIACGVGKAGARMVQIAGGEGNTGASPYSSICHAGGPPEVGLAEAHQALVEMGLRPNVLLGVDGGVRTAKHRLIFTALGAQRFVEGLPALICMGCVKCNVCHEGTCPVGVATNRRDLVAKYRGRPENIVLYFTAIAEEMRREMAALGISSLDLLVGRSDLLYQRTDTPRMQYYSETIDCRAIFGAPLVVEHGPLPVLPDPPIRTMRHIDPSVDDHVLTWARNVIAAGQGNIKLDTIPLRITQRSIGGRIGGVVALQHGITGIDGLIEVPFTGSAGQSFGWCLPRGFRFVLRGDANDYVGKSLAGGEIWIMPPEDAAYDPLTSTLLGNTALYGATGGTAYFAGPAGERFAVRNSGATAVVCGTGDHACEYMTRGYVVILGPTGFNVGAGMGGGEVLIYDPQGSLEARLNSDWVKAQELQAGDRGRLIETLQAFVQATGQKTATEILADPDAHLRHFRKVTPKKKPVVSLQVIASPAMTLQSASA